MFFKCGSQEGLVDKNTKELDYFWIIINWQIVKTEIHLLLSFYFYLIKIHLL